MATPIPVPCQADSAIEAAITGAAQIANEAAISADQTKIGNASLLAARSFRMVATRLEAPSTEPSAVRMAATAYQTGWSVISPATAAAKPSIVSSRACSATTGNAVSPAPIWSGTIRVPKPPSSAGRAEKNKRSGAWARASVCHPGPRLAKPGSRSSSDNEQAANPIASAKARVAEPTATWSGT